MGYYDPPDDEPEFFGCPLCKNDEWIDQNGEVVCPDCGIKLTFVNEHWDYFYKVILPIDPPPPPPDIDDDVWQPLSPEEEKLLEIAAYETEQARLKELGYLDEDGEPTDAYYRESDFQYDCWRERQNNRR